MSLLAHPRVYLIVQGLLGALRSRRILVSEIGRPAPQSRVLDFGCGPGFLIDYLPDCDYVGDDVSTKYIEFAKRNYGHKGEFHRITEEQSDFEYLGQFDYIFLCGLIHHLSDSQTHRLLNKLNRMLNPKGQLLTLDGCYKTPQSKITRYLLDHDRGRYVRDQDEYVTLVNRSLEVVDTHLRDDMFHIPYTILVLECERR